MKEVEKKKVKRHQDVCARYAYCEDFEKSEWRYFFKETNLIASVERMKKR